MRDSNRIPEMINALFTVWQANPDMRLGQLVFNAIHSNWETQGRDIFYVEDDVILEGLKKMADK